MMEDKGTKKRKRESNEQEQSAEEEREIDREQIKKPKAPEAKPLTPSHIISAINAGSEGALQERLLALPPPEKKLLIATPISDEGNDEQLSPLYVAALKGRSGVTEWMLAGFSNAEKERLITAAVTIGEKKGNLGFTPLYTAVAKGHQETVKKLLYGLSAETIKKLITAAIAAGRDEGLSPLFVAVFNGQTETLKWLLSPFNVAERQGLIQTAMGEGDVGGRTPLYIAVATGKTDTLKELLSHFPDAAQRQALIQTAMGEGFAEGNSLLFIAAVKGKTDMIKELLSHFPDAAQRRALIQTTMKEGSSKGQTPFYIAAVYGRADAIKELLSHFDVAQRQALIQTAMREGGAKGKTPLYFAAAHGMTDPLKELLSHFDVAQRQALIQTAMREGHATGQTPFYSAAANGMTDTLKELLSHFDASQRQALIQTAMRGGGAPGQTPLYSAAANGHTNTVKALLAGFSLQQCSELINTAPFPLYWTILHAIAQLEKISKENRAVSEPGRIAQANLKETIRLLIYAGADPSIKEKGKTVFDLVNEAAIDDSYRLELASCLSTELDVFIDELTQEFYLLTKVIKGEVIFAGNIVISKQERADSHIATFPVKNISEELWGSIKQLRSSRDTEPTLFSSTRAEKLNRLVASPALRPTEKFIHKEEMPALELTVESSQKLAILMDKLHRVSNQLIKYRSPDWGDNWIAQMDNRRPITHTPSKIVYLPPETLPPLKVSQQRCISDFFKKIPKDNKHSSPSVEREKIERPAPHIFKQEPNPPVMENIKDLPEENNQRYSKN